MNTVLSIDPIWMWFCIASALAFFFSLLMSRASTELMTLDGSLREFTITDLEFPSNNLDIPFIINGVFRLPDPAQQNRVIKALKRILYLDFLFMPAIYTAIFLICMQVAIKLPENSFGQYLFAAFAWLQAVAWLCDILENLHLLNWAHKELKIAKPAHQRYVLIVWIKWGIALVGSISALMMLVYFWMKSAYAPSSLWWLGVYVAELVLFWLARKYWLVKKVNIYN